MNATATTPKLTANYGWQAEYNGVTINYWGSTPYSEAYYVWEGVTLLGHLHREWDGSLTAVLVDANRRPIGSRHATSRNNRRTLAGALAALRRMAS